MPQPTPAVTSPPAPADDVDLVLRHVSRLFPTSFARALLPPKSTITSATWLETQVTARQRRLDRALAVQLADGQHRLLHTEWQFRMSADVPFRVYEYHSLLSFVLHDEQQAAETAKAAPSAAKRDGQAAKTLPHASKTEGKAAKPAVKGAGWSRGAARARPCIESTVVLLAGREKPWPAWGRYRTSPPDAPFSGVRFRIEAVYQRTVAELEAKGSPLWLIFAPLARDATPARMAQVVTALRTQTSAREFDELAVALTVLADADRRQRPGLRHAIMAQLPKELIMQSWVYKQGRKEGIEKGREQGLEKGREQGLKPFERLLERRVGRALSEAEHRTLSERVATLGPDRLSDVALELSGEALAAWLNDANAR
jgi:predicted transposase YdaD